MKNNITSILIGLSLLAIPAAFADFVIGGNSSNTGYGYGYGNCSTDGNGGFMSPCTTTGSAWGYGYGAGGQFYPGSPIYGNTVGGSTSGSSLVSNSYVSVGTSNSLGLPQTSGTNNTVTGTTTTTVVTITNPVVTKPVKTVKNKGTLSNTGSDSMMYVLLAAAIFATATFVATRKNKNA